MHLDFNKKNKRREIQDAMYQLQRGCTLPVSDDQTVVNRSCAAYLDLEHEKVSEWFVHVGIAADLFGADDSKLTASMKVFFRELSEPSKPPLL